MLYRSLLGAIGLALMAGTVAWALAGVPGAPAVCPAGGCDCEAARSGPNRQPVNAWSSLALWAAGLALLASPAAAGEERGAAGAERRGHQLPAAAGEAREAAGAERRGHGAAVRYNLAASALVLSGLVAFLFHSSLTAWAARLDGVAAGALVAALAAHRWWPRERRPVTGRRGLALGTMLPWLLLVLGGACWLLGRSGGPWCRPASLLQAHAAWHLLAGGAIFLWLRRGRPEGRGASPIPPRPLASRPEDATAHDPAP